MKRINYIAYTLVCVINDLSDLFDSCNDIDDIDENLICNRLRAIKEVVRLKDFFVFPISKNCNCSFDIELYFYNYENRIIVNFWRKQDSFHNSMKYIPRIKNRTIVASEYLPLKMEGLVFCSRKKNILLVCDDMCNFPYFNNGEIVELETVMANIRLFRNYYCMLSLKQYEINKFVEMNRNTINRVFVQNICTNGLYLEDIIDANKVISQLNLDGMDAVVGLSDELNNIISNNCKLNNLTLSSKCTLVDDTRWVKKAIRLLYDEYIYVNDRRGLKESVCGLIRDYSLSHLLFKKLCYETLSKDEAKYFFDSLN